MKNYTKIYCDYFGYQPGDFIPCEVCGVRSVDIHHIKCRGMGGNPSGDKDRPVNLMALCRRCHESFGDKRQYMDYLQTIHNKKLKQ